MIFFSQITETNGLDDKITLTALGVTTHWQFPKSTNTCPVPGCKKNFPNRAAAIAHYRAQHAKHSICCPICDKPISSYRTYDFVVHYRRIHPDVKQIPFNLGQNIEQSIKVEGARQRREVCMD